MRYACSVSKGAVSVASDIDFFSADYEQARERFRRQAAIAGARLWALALDARGPVGEDLSIDVAWLGRADASRLVVVQSGVHGVEAFAGAAVQLELLGRPPTVATDTALVLIHVVNPYGMAWLRRVNENNVDLNRNCLDRGDRYRGAPRGYRALDRLINPPTAPGFDFFTLRVGWRIVRHGFEALKVAVATGQYEFPQGLFYGGAELEQGSALLRDWLEHIEAPVAEVQVLDLHSGLGRFGGIGVFPDHCTGPNAQQRLRKRFGDMHTAQGSSGPGYRIRGGVANLYRQTFPGITNSYLTVEFGTYSMLRVLHALREENRWHFYGGAGLEHQAKAKLREALGPADPRWRRSVLHHGGSLVALAAGN
jgi:hypothetical protein